MTILLVGLNYQIAPIELRERLVLNGEALLQTLHRAALAEVVIVSTCNRFEIYANTNDPAAATATIIRCLAERADVDEDELRHYFEARLDQNAVEHILRVASGLESLVLGESEILGQVADALKQAQQAGTLGAVLARLFQNAIHTGKRARSETAISQHTLSVSHAAVLMAQRQLGDLSAATVVIIGAGRMAELAVHAWHARGSGKVSIINRSFSRASALAHRTGAQVMAWEHRQVALQEADVVIAATSAAQAILGGTDFASVTHPVIVLDIGVPRNVQAEAGQLSHIQLYAIDDLQAVVADHRVQRQAEVARVEQIIAAELDAYAEWLNIRSAAATIGALRHKAEGLAEAELARAFHRLPDLSEREQEVIAQMAHRLVNKIMHAPTIALRERAAQGDHFTYLHAVSQLFDLEIDHD